MNKQIHIATITSADRFAVEKPRYNAHQAKTGAHKSKKAYTRKTKHRQEW